ncbi:cell surface protein [Weissella koreensis]|uniref:cell surface protein n=1 Tax=Weissella koreensis TaxID=165096 RepID=UPI0022BA7271|nr:cell surface protein [Weissella koreensis]MCZ9310653.1 cell surface protein [Weissella koreensis]
MHKIKDLWSTTLWFKIVVILFAIFIAYSLPTFAIFVGFVIFIYSIVSYIKKFNLKKTTRFNPNYLLLAGVIPMIIGLSNPSFYNDTNNQNENTSSSIKKDNNSQAKASSESKAIAKSESESKAKSESIEKKKESESIATSQSAESQSIVDSESTANSISVDESTKASESYQQAQAQQVEYTQTTPSNSGGSRTGSHWAIQDGYDWYTRKGHSHIIPAGGALPTGYHWEVNH